MAKIPFKALEKSANSDHSSLNLYLKSCSASCQPSEKTVLICIQVCRTLPEDSDCEVNNLLAIRDHYPKYVVTLDDFAGGNVDGVKIMHLTDFFVDVEDTCKGY